MRAQKLLSIFALLTVTIVSCSNYSAISDRTNTAILPDTGKTIVVDVRTVDEWNNDGHAACSVNYPMDELSSKIETLKAFEKVILVCRSGNRAGFAKEMLERNGIKKVENKGAWQNIVCKRITV